MGIVSRDRLARACREADPATVREFVAALYEARGYAVDREGDLLTLSPGGRTVAVLPSGRPPDAADAVVSFDPDVIATDDRQVIGVDTLYRQLCYALGRGVARDLLATHFGIDVDDGTVAGVRSSAGGASAPDRSSGTGETPTVADVVAILPWRSNRQVATLVLAAGVVVLVAVALGGVAEVPVGSASPPAGTPSTPTPTTTPGPASTTDGTTPIRSANVTTPRTGGAHADQVTHPFPPGLGPGGITDAGGLVDGHRSALANTSYTMTLRYQEFVNGRLTGTYVERIRVENETRYSVSVSTTGKLETTPRAVVGSDLFVNATSRYIRDRSAGSYFQSRATPSRMLRQAGQYLHWSLTAEESAVRDRQTVGNRTTYRVTTTGDQYPAVDNAEGTAYVTERGLVTYGRWTYTRAGRPGVRVEFVFQTTGVGTTTVSRPGWIDRE